MESFRLIEYLSADLHRLDLVLRGNNVAPPGRIRLWMGLFSPRFLPVFFCRVSHWLYFAKLGILAKLFSLLNFFLFGIEIAVRCPIGKGLFLPHTQGTVIGAWSIGTNVTIFQGVTIGANEVDFSYTPSSRPILGDGVVIGSGAKVLGGIRIGNNTRIGANSVVLHSLPANVVAVGAPAKVVKSL